MFISCEQKYFYQFYMRSFPVAASIFWNSLPPEIQPPASLIDFFYKLKTYLFHQSIAYMVNIKQ